MSWRFRKSFKVFPGVRLNVTRRGLSATLGAAPFSVNVGPRGVYRNISIPGTGIWDRTRLDVPSHSPSASTPPSSAPVPPPVPPCAESVHEIRSASTELLNSESLEDLRKLLKQAYDERAELTSEIAVAERDASIAAHRFQSWEKGIILKRLFKQSFAKRKETHETALAKCEELNEQLRLTTVATEMNLDAEQAEPYYRMRDDFAAASESRRIWDTLDRRPIDRSIERSAAHQAIKREPVLFSLNTCDLIQWEQKVPHLPNRTGGDMYIYPGFILYRASKQAFALVDSRDVTLTFRQSRFIEEEALPSDTHIVGQAWAKSNKDGTPDRRFRDNHQIPIVLYGSLIFTSPSGLQEEFQLSDPALAERFAKAWDRFQQSFTRSTGHNHSSAESERAVTPKSTTPRDVATAFAEESETARKLASEHGEFWEFLLTEVLLRSKLIEVKSEYDQFEAFLRLTPKRDLNGAAYLHWLGPKPNELASLINRLAESVNRELAAGLGKPGQSGDEIGILNAVNQIIECCRGCIRWELEICSATPPERLRPLGATLRGIAGGVIADVEHLLDDFARIVDGARQGTRNFKISLTLSTPPGIAKWLAEMENIKKHPEWLTP